MRRRMFDDMEPDVFEQQESLASSRGYWDEISTDVPITKTIDSEYYVLANTLCYSDYRYFGSNDTKRASLSRNQSTKKLHVAYNVPLNGAKPKITTHEYFYYEIPGEKEWVKSKAEYNKTQDQSQDHYISYIDDMLEYLMPNIKKWEQCFNDSDSINSIRALIYPEIMATYNIITRSPLSNKAIVKNISDYRMDIYGVEFSVKPSDQLKLLYTIDKYPFYQIRKLGIFWKSLIHHRRVAYCNMVCELDPVNGYVMTQYLNDLWGNDYFDPYILRRICNTIICDNAETNSRFLLLDTRKEQIEFIYSLVNIVFDKYVTDRLIGLTEIFGTNNLYEMMVIINKIYNYFCVDGVGRYIAINM